jgi:hypothetical protein
MHSTLPLLPRQQLPYARSPPTIYLINADPFATGMSEANYSVVNISNSPWASISSELAPQPNTAAARKFSTEKV